MILKLGPSNFKDIIPRNEQVKILFFVGGRFMLFGIIMGQPTHVCEYTCIWNIQPTTMKGSPGVEPKYAVRMGVGR
jgi:hypothetical protein